MKGNLTQCFYKLSRVPKFHKKWLKFWLKSCLKKILNDTVAVKQAVKWSHFKTWNRLRRSAPLSFQNGIKFLHRRSNAKQNLEIQVFCYLRSKIVEIPEQKLISSVLKFLVFDFRTLQSRNFCAINLEICTHYKVRFDFEFRIMSKTSPLYWS